MFRKPSSIIAVLILLAGLGLYLFSIHESPPAIAPRPILLRPAIAATGKDAPPPLTCWVSGAHGDDALWQRRAEEFRIQSGRPVEITFYEADDLCRKALAKARHDGTLPDVFLLDALDAESWHKSGDLALQDFPATESAYWLPAAVHALQRDDKLLAWPCDFSLLALYYNRSVFDRLGIAYPDIHWNWTILLALSRTLYRPEAGNGKAPTYGIEFPFNFDLWQAMARQAGHGIYHDAVWELGRTDGVLPQTAALEFMRDYFKVYIVAAPPRTEATGDYFRRGEAILCIAGPDLMPRLQGRTDFHWDVAPLPRGEVRATTLQVDGWAVSAQSHDPYAASQLAQFLAHQPQHAGWLPVYEGAGAPARTPEQEVFYRAAADAQGPPFLERAPEIEAFVNRELLNWIKQPDPSIKDFINLVNNNFKLQPKE